MTSSTAAMTPTGSAPDGSGVARTYGRARLLLGMSGVGTWVVLAATALAGGLPERLTGLTEGSLGADLLAVCALAVAVVVVQALFDLLGGFVLPRRFGRSTERFAVYARRWLRGVAVYQAVYVLFGVALLLASRGLGVPGMLLLGVASSIALLVVRTPLARVVGGLDRPQPSESLGADAAVIDSPDVGFTGGIEGVLGARRQIVPVRWEQRLSAELLSLAIRRRREAVTSGLWRRGRLGAIAFTWIGFAIAGSQVAGLAGTSGGVVTFAAVFTLWSFLGLLVLPTLSRRASLRIDERLKAQGVDADGPARLAAALDAMQDDEPTRPKWVERIFHPIPNVNARGGAPASLRFAAWDIARTAAFLGLSGLSPLGRAVHCNSGRPPLWVYLPSD